MLGYYDRDSCAAKARTRNFHEHTGYDTVLREIKGQWQGRHPIRYCAVRMVTVTRCTSTSMTASGTGTTTGSTMIATLTTRPQFSQLSSFLPLLI